MANSSPRDRVHWVSLTVKEGGTASPPPAFSKYAPGGESGLERTDWTGVPLVLGFVSNEGYSGADLSVIRWLLSEDVHKLAAKSKKNYAQSLLVFLRHAEKRCEDIRLADWEDFKKWRAREATSGAQFQLDHTAAFQFFQWAFDNGLLSVELLRNPIPPAVGIYEADSDANPKRTVSGATGHARAHRYRWATPKTLSLFRDAGLNGHRIKKVNDADAWAVSSRIDPKFTGEQVERNQAFFETLRYSGLRLAEGSSLMTVELPETLKEGIQIEARAKYKTPGTFFLPMDDPTVKGTMDEYLLGPRRVAIEIGQKKGLYTTDDMIKVDRVEYDPMRGIMLFLYPHGSGVKFAHQCDWETVRRFVIEGDNGWEPLALWLKESGEPIDKTSTFWGVFDTANKRLKRLAAEQGVARDYPKINPHSLRFSYGLNLSLFLFHFTSKKKPELFTSQRGLEAPGLSPVWLFMQHRMRHRQLKQTRDTYLAPLQSNQHAWWPSLVDGETATAAVNAMAQHDPEILSLVESG